MAKTKKRTQSKTPKRRKSSRNRKPTEKGKLYNENFDQCNESGVSTPIDSGGCSAVQENGATIGNKSIGEELGPNDLSTPVVNTVEGKSSTSTSIDLSLIHI